MRWMFAIATMPVILEPSDWPLWLGEVIDDPATVLRPAGDDLLTVWPVSRRVSASQVPMGRNCWNRLGEWRTGRIAQ